MTSKKGVKVVQFQMIVGSTLIATAIAGILKAGKKLDRDIHRVAVSAINHNELHGDPCHINALVAAMPKGSRIKALNDWFCAFGKVKYSTETKEFQYDKTAKTDLDGGIGKSWTDFAPEAPYVPFNLQAVLKKVLEQGYKRAKIEGKGDEVDVVTLNQLSEIMGFVIPAAMPGASIEAN